MKIFFYCLLCSLTVLSNLETLALAGDRPIERIAVATKVDTNPYDPIQTLTLDQAIQASKLRNADYQAFQSKLGVSKAQILTAKGRLNPALLSDNGIAEKTYRLGLEQTFEVGGKRNLRTQVAKAQQDVLFAELDTELLNLRNSVRQAYTQLYNAKEKQATYQNLLEVAQKLTKIAGERERAGDISKLDVLQTEIMSVNANNDLQYVNTEVSTAQIQLNTLLNQPLDTELTLAPPNKSVQFFPRMMPSSLALPPCRGASCGLPETSTGGHKTLPYTDSLNPKSDADLTYLLDTAYKNRPELRQNQGSQTVIAKQLLLARANRIPNVMLTAGADMVTGSSGSSTSLGAFVIGRVEVPVLNRQQGPIQEALARQVQLDKENAALRLKIKSQVHKSLITFQSNKARIERYETVLLPMSLTIMDKSRRAFLEGKTSVLMAMNAQQAYMNTRLGYLQSLLDYQTAIGDLERTVGSEL